MLAEVVQSLQGLYHHGASANPGKDPIKYAVVELRGDWKWQQDTCFGEVVKDPNIMRFRFLMETKVNLIKSSHFGIPTHMPYGSNHLLRMVMEPKYLSEEVIIHPKHHLTR